LKNIFGRCTTEKKKYFRRKTFWLGVKTISPFQDKWSVPKMIRYLDVAIMEMRGLDHCKTWFNRPFPLDIPHYCQYRYSYSNFSCCRLLILSIVDYPILTNPFRNLPWCSVICYYLYIFLLHYKYGRGIFLPLCVCTYTNVIQFG
jgi:hypothetical protein